MTKEQKEEFLQYLENLKVLHADDYFCEGLDMAISALKGGWIPVTERLPEEGKNVLFCDIDNDIMLGYHLTYAPATHFIDKSTWDDVKNVRAWMELPEPYKAESEDKE